MTGRDASRAGLVLVAVFLAMSAARDVFFAKVFQGIDVFAVTALVFGATAVLFAGSTLRDRRQWRRSERELPSILAVNALTAAAWLSYLWAVKLLEPAVANTIWSGVGPLTVASLAARAPGARRTAPAEPFSGLERLAHLGMLGTLVFLAVAAIGGHSGISTTAPWRTAAGVALAAGSGVAIAVAIVVTKRLHDAGLSARQVVALRFCLLVIVAGLAGIAGLGGGSAGLTGAGQRFTDAAHLVPAGLVLVALPIYALQAAVVRLRPMTIEAIAALGPPLVFALQAFDGRLHFSSFTLAGVMGYAACTILAAAARLAGRP
ncbi:MAG TPA: hypothetical protein VFT22_34160 [Kofleriaceae bacterium]|nr:hypothetical protein [Kofleriaceae bacterium]